MNLISRNFSVSEFEVASVAKLITLERWYSKLFDDAWFSLPLARWSLRLIYLPAAAAATRIPITNFPYDVAFRALRHHWKVLFSQELTSFSKNRSELCCRASPSSRRQRVHAILQVGIESTSKRKGADSILSRKMPRDGAGEMGLLTRRMKLLKRQRHVYLTMKAVTSVARREGEN